MRSAAAALVLLLLAGSSFAHPGSAIHVHRGNVYFVDTGSGVWKADGNGRLTRVPGPAFHWMALDVSGAFANTAMPPVPGGELRAVNRNPTLILSSDVPVTVGRDGALYHAEMQSGGLQLMRVAPSGERRIVRAIPGTIRWLNGIAAAPDGSIYYSERDAVRKIAPNGRVSTIAGNITVPDCAPVPADEPGLGANLRGLTVADDGTVYVAAAGCAALLRITPRGAVSTVLRVTPPWSPTAVALSGEDIYVLEYLHTPADDRVAWIPRVRKISPGGVQRIVASITR